MNVGTQERTVVSAKHLPKEIDGFEQVAWSNLADCWGFRVVGDVNADIFAVELAQGWHLLHGVQGSLWSFLYDPAGRERASVYYGKQGSSEGARMYLYRHYNIYTHYSDPSNQTVRIITGRDYARIFREFGRVFSDDPNYFAEVDRIQGEAQAWFDRYYPDWRDPFAYWEVK